MDQKPLGKQQQRKAQNQQRICSLQKILEEFFPTQNDIPCREYLTPQKNNLGSPWKENSNFVSFKIWRMLFVQQFFRTTYEITKIYKRMWVLVQKLK